MKIAVFGDSYANYLLEPEHDHLGKSWCDVVAEQHSLTNYGRWASCFQYSYELFLKHNREFGYNIFFVTTPRRKYVKELDNLQSPTQPQMLNDENVRNGLKSYIQNNNLDPKLLRILDSVECYINDWQDVDFEQHIHDLLVRNILATNKNTLLIASFPETIPFADCGFDKNLTCIQFNELALAGADKEKINNSGFECKRRCHLSEENNIVLGNKILEAIHSKNNILNLNIKDFVKPSKHYEYYVDWMT